MAKSNNKKEDQQKSKIIAPINMPFEDALKKALNTTLPEHEKKLLKSKRKSKIPRLHIPHF